MCMCTFFVDGNIQNLGLHDGRCFAAPAAKRNLLHILPSAHLHPLFIVESTLPLLRGGGDRAGDSTAT